MSKADSPKKYSIDLSKAMWRKSSMSNSQGNCVEIAFIDSHVAVRDSKNLQAQPLVYTPDEWKAFVWAVQHDEFNLPQA